MTVQVEQLFNNRRILMVITLIMFHNSQILTVMPNLKHPVHLWSTIDQLAVANLTLMMRGQQDLANSLLTIEPEEAFNTN